MTTFSDWRAALAALEDAHGLASGHQRDVADRLEVPLAGREPRPVVDAMLQDQFWGRLGHPPEPASARQRDYLDTLLVETISEEQVWGQQHEATTATYLISLRDEKTGQLLPLSWRRASAWIGHVLARRTMAALERLEPAPGDLVLCRRRFRRYYCPGDVRRKETHVVSSISNTGRVNFKQTQQSYQGWNPPARHAWPTDLEMIAPAEVLPADADPQPGGWSAA